MRLGLSLPDDGHEGAEDLVAEVIAAIEGKTAFAQSGRLPSRPQRSEPEANEVHRYAGSGSVSPLRIAGP